MGTSPGKVSGGALPDVLRVTAKLNTVTVPAL